MTLLSNICDKRMFAWEVCKIREANQVGLKRERDMLRALNNFPWLHVAGGDPQHGMRPESRRA